jgi:hypothetical protein
MQPEPTVIYEDNQACFKVALNDMIQPRTKHVKIRYHFSREMIKEKLVKLVYCPTELMSADALTKALFQEKWDIFKKVLLLEDTRIDQSGSVEDGPVAAINVTAHLVSFEIPAQSGEEDEAWGKPEASKRQARGAGSIPLLWQ